MLKAPFPGRLPARTLTALPPTAQGGRDESELCDKDQSAFQGETFSLPVCTRQYSGTGIGSEPVTMPGG